MGLRTLLNVFPKYVVRTRNYDVARHSLKSFSTNSFRLFNIFIVASSSSAHLFTSPFFSRIVHPFSTHVQTTLGLPLAYSPPKVTFNIPLTCSFRRWSFGWHHTSTAALVFCFWSTIEMAELCSTSRKHVLMQELNIQFKGRKLNLAIIREIPINYIKYKIATKLTIQIKYFTFIYW